MLKSQMLDEQKIEIYRVTNIFLFNKKKVIGGVQTSDHRWYNERECLKIKFYYLFK